MKVLLVNTNREKAPQTLVPLGICCVASAAAAAGHEVRVLDLCFERRAESAVSKAAAEWKPDVVAFSVRNLDNCDFTSPRSLLPEVRLIIQAARSACDALIVIGGPAVSSAPAELLRFFEADAAVVGEGEVSFPALLDALGSGADAGSVPGVVTAGGGWQPAPLIEDLDSLPDADPGRWLDLRRYAAYGASMPVQTKRGCALSCEYCCYPDLEGSGWRLRQPERVAAQVAAASGSPLRVVEVVDGVFGLPVSHGVACCEAVARLPRRRPLSTLDLNPAACVPDLIDAMNAAGFIAVGISAESASDQVLSALGKNYSADSLEKAREAATKLKARRIWMFIVGGPGETEQTLAETVRFIERLPASDLVMVSQGIRVLPGAPIRRHLVEQGELQPEADPVGPLFYHSPHVTPQRVRQVLAGARFPSVNVSLLTDGGHPLAPLAQRAAAVLRLQPPYWRHLPTMNRARKFLRL